MFKKYKNLIFLFLSSVLILVVFVIITNHQEKEDIIEAVRIAACPTFYYRLDHLKNNDNYSIILTDSTAISLEMLKRGEVDYAIGGRELMPNEPDFNYQAIGDGFSFISDQSKVVYDFQLSLQTIYSDLDKEILKENFGDLDYNIVDDVYEYLKDGNIIITTWENSDFNRAEIVHLLKADNLRNIKSRLPTVFCYSRCEDNYIRSIKQALIN